MKVIYINKDIYFKKFKDLKLNNNIHDRYLVFKFLEKNLKTKFTDFYLFYDKSGELNCIIEAKELKDDFEILKDPDNFLKQEINDYKLYKKSIEVAKKSHGKQIYGGFLPYFFHLNKVDKVIDHFFYSLPQDKLFILKICSILHDTIEDTPYTLNDLQKDFGDEIKTIVFNVTKVDEKDTKIYEEEYYDKVASNPLSVYVKIADKIINGKQTLKDKTENHIKGMTRGHPLFKEITYPKIENNDIKLFLDSVMNRMEKLKNK